jgi:hypothetical protein
MADASAMSWTPTPLQLDTNATTRPFVDTEIGGKLGAADGSTDSFEIRS